MVDVSQVFKLVRSLGFCMIGTSDLRYAFISVLVTYLKVAGQLEKKTSVVFMLNVSTLSMFTSCSDANCLVQT